MLRFVKEEITAYLETRRAVSVIDVGQALASAPWAALVVGPAPIIESPEAVQGGQPTAGVVAMLVASLRFIRAKTRIRALSIGALALILAAAGVSVLFSQRVRSAVAAQARAEQDERASNDLAEKAGARLQSATEKISAADQTLADRQVQLTQTEAELASKAREVDALDQKAKKLDELATQRHQLNLAQKLVALAEQERKESTLGVLEAAESLRITPTVEADRLLRSQLATLTPRATRVDDGTGNRGVVFAPDGTALFADSLGKLEIANTRGEHVASNVSPTVAERGIFADASVRALATVDGRAQVAFWRWDGKELLADAPAMPPSGEEVGGFAFVPFTPYMILYRPEQEEIWSTQGRELKRTVPNAFDVALASNGRIAYLDTHRKLWAGPLSAASDRFIAQMDKWSHGVTLSPDGRWLFVVDLHFRAFDLDSGNAVSVPVSSENAECTSVAFSADGKRVALATLESTDVLETGTWRKLFTIPGTAGVAAFGSEGSLLALAWSDVAKVYSFGDLMNGSLEPSGWASAGGVFKQLSFAPGDQYLLGIVQDPEHPVVGNTWNLAPAVRRRDLASDAAGLVACGRDRIGYLSDGHAIVWDTRRNSELFREPARSMTCTPDGQRLILEYDGKLSTRETRTWSVQSQRDSAMTDDIVCDAKQCVTLTVRASERAVVARLDTGAMLAAKQWPYHMMELVGWEVSPGGHWLARSSSEGSVLVWDLRTGAKVIDERIQDGGIFGFDALAFSPSSDRFAAGTSDGRVFVWSLAASATKLTTLFPEAGVIMARKISFNSDGTRLLEVADSTFTLFDIARSQAIISPLAAEHRRITGALLTQGGESLLLATTDGEGGGHAAIEELHLSPKLMLEDACLRVHRNMSATEWVHAMGYAPYRKTCDSLPGEGKQ